MTYLATVLALTTDFSYPAWPGLFGGVSSAMA
jgi:hypothetical protein